MVMKVLVAAAAIIMLSSVGMGVILSSGPHIRSVQWTGIEASSSDLWSPDTRLTMSPLPSEWPAVATGPDGNLNIVWTDFRAGEPDIHYMKVDPRGERLVPETRISSSLSQSKYPAIATDGAGFVHVAWLDDRGGVWNVYYARLDGNGAVVVTDLQLTDIGPGLQDAGGRLPVPGVQRVDHLSTFLDIEGRRPSVAVDERMNAHIAWCDFRDGESNVRYTVLGAGGSILTDQARISEGPNDATNAVVRVRGQETAVFWAERSGETSSLYYTRVDYSGNILVEPMAVASERSSGLALDAALDADGNARLAWSLSDGLNCHVRYARVDAYGSLMGPVTDVASTRLESGHPSIAVEPTGAIHLAWTTEPERLQRVDLSGIFYTRLTAEGEELVSPVPISSAPLRSQGPALAVSDEGLPTVVWSDGRDGPPNSELYLKTRVKVETVSETSGTLPVTVPGNDYVPAAVAAGGLGVLVAAALTEAGRWKLAFLAVPLYSRLRKEGLLNHAIREQIFGYVNEHPGANFSTMMRDLNLKNGVLAYHLTTLEREDMIRSMRDGTLRRYYPRSGRAVPFETRKAILGVIEQNPGLTEAALAGRTGLSRQVLDYHLASLIDSGHVRLERRGKRNLAFVTQVAA
ncbi:MAG: winged helix-turn-helix transcriptional regulator [Euryarchaeota archaeon]|nr:winged helix-turn-helix transcriptional regulator [Euryarchaeota archaeon]